MPLSIKDPEADRLARQLADLEGVSMTQVVIEALRDRLEREVRQKKVDHGGLVEELMDIGKHCANLPVLDDRSADQILYNEHGLPD